jgi:hypothetical protein
MYDSYWALAFRVTTKGSASCQHEWKKVFEGPRAKKFLGIFRLPCLRSTHCDGRHMVRAELAIVLRCQCGAECEAVYGERGRLCLICNHNEPVAPLVEETIWKRQPAARCPCTTSGAGRARQTNMLPNHHGTNSRVRPLLPAHKYLRLERKVKKSSVTLTLGRALV